MRPFPRGPKDQKNSRFRSGLKISSENEIFERATHRGPIFCGEIDTSRLKFSSEIKNFDRDQKFRSGSNFFDRWALWVAPVCDLLRRLRSFALLCGHAFALFCALLCVFLRPTAFRTIAFGNCRTTHLYPMLGADFGTQALLLFLTVVISFLAFLSVGNGARDHSKGGLFTEGLSRISKISIFSRISRKGRILLCFPQTLVVTLFFSSRPPPRLVPHHRRTPSQRVDVESFFGRFRVDSSRFRVATQNRLENDRKTTRNRPPGRGVGGDGG